MLRLYHKPIPYDIKREALSLVMKFLFESLYTFGFQYLILYVREKIKGKLKRQAIFYQM